MPQFLSDNATAIFGIAGVILGSVLTFVGAMMLKRRDYTLEVWRKLLERRIAAHENVIRIAIEMRFVTSLHGFDEHGEIRRMPTVLLSKDEFIDFFTRFTQFTGAGSTWLTVAAKREVNFTQDYLATLHEYLDQLSSEECVVIGEKVRQDFIDISSALEKVAFNFFENDARKLRLDSLTLHHKYDFEKTMKRLNETSLMREVNAELNNLAED